MTISTLKKQEALTAERLRELLNYEPDTGVFTRKVSIKGGGKAGSVAGTTAKRGYRQIQLDGQLYFEHRLAYLHMTGSWPADQVDHMDGDPSNNAWRNLRQCTASRNQQNRVAGKNNTSGYMGVTRHGTAGKWAARISVDKVHHHLGLFHTVEEAGAAYLEAKTLHHHFQPVPRDVMQAAQRFVQNVTRIQPGLLAEPSAPYRPTTIVHAPEVRAMPVSVLGMGVGSLAFCLPKKSTKELFAVRPKAAAKPAPTIRELFALTKPANEANLLQQA